MAAGLGEAMVGRNFGASEGKITKGGKPEMRVSRLDIEIADNGGFTVTCYKEPKGAKGKKMSEPMAFEKPSKHVFSTKDELETYIDDTLGTGDDSGDSESAGESGTDAGEGDSGDAY